MRWLALVLVVACAHHAATIVARPAPARCIAPRRPAIAVATESASGPIEHVDVRGIDDRALLATLRDVLSTRAGGRIEDAPFIDDLHALWRTGLISDARVEVEGAVVTFVVAPLSTVGAVSIVGAASDSPRLRRLAWLAGTPLDPARVQHFVAMIVDAYRADGHLDATIDVVRDRDDLCFDVRPGRRFVFGAIHFVGDLGEPEATLRTLVHAKVGEPFDLDVFERDQLDILDHFWNLGRLNVTLGKPDVVRVGSALDIQIRVEAGPVYRVGDVRLGGIEHGPVEGLRRGEIASRARVIEVREQLERRFGERTKVTPISHVDQATATVDYTFEVTWKEP